SRGPPPGPTARSPVPARRRTARPRTGAVRRTGAAPGPAPSAPAACGRSLGHPRQGQGQVAERTPGEARAVGPLELLRPRLAAALRLRPCVRGAGALVAHPRLRLAPARLVPQRRAPLRLAAQRLAPAHQRQRFAPRPLVRDSLRLRLRL